MQLGKLNGKLEVPQHIIPHGFTIGLTILHWWSPCSWSKPVSLNGIQSSLYNLQPANTWLHTTLTCHHHLNKIPNLNDTKWRFIAGNWEHHSAIHGIHVSRSDPCDDVVVLPPWAASVSPEESAGCPGTIRERIGEVVPMVILDTQRIPSGKLT